MVGFALGLGNVWRFPYMVGRFGGAAFVLFYVLVVLVIGVPGLMAETALGRYTRRGTVGAFERAGLPAGKAVGWFFFAIVVAATGYYINVIGWVRVLRRRRDRARGCASGSTRPRCCRRTPASRRSRCCCRWSARPP